MHGSQARGRRAVELLLVSGRQRALRGAEDAQNRKSHHRADPQAAEIALACGFLQIGHVLFTRSQRVAHFQWK